MVPPFLLLQRLRLKFYLSLYGHRLPVMTLDVSDDSQLIASGSADKNVRRAYGAEICGFKADELGISHDLPSGNLR